MEMKYYYREASRPIRLGETRLPDKVLDVSGSLLDIFQTVKNDDDLDKYLYSRIDDVVEFWPKDHGYDIYFYNFDDLLDFLPHDFIKQQVKENRHDMLASIEYLLQISPYGYVFSVKQCGDGGLKRTLYSDVGN